MLRLEEAVQRLMENTAKISDTEIVSIQDAVGRVLAEDKRAEADQPPFPRSPVDGYALRSSDTVGAARECPKILRVVGKVYAGGVFDGSIGGGDAVRIMTGAPIPRGADAVIRQEDTDYGEEQVEIFKNLLPYENYCLRGEDYKRDDLILKEGCTITGISAGMLASLGIDRVRVYRNARIAVISTGDELKQPGELLELGQIYDSNQYLIGGRLAEMGVPPAVTLHCMDNTEMIAGEIKRLSLSCDMIITIGGVAVGQKDMMHEVIEKISARKLFWKVEMKPGASVLAAVYNGRPLIGLSGNPFAASANFELLVRPALAKMTRNAKINMKRREAVLQNEFFKNGKARRFVRGYVSAEKVWIFGKNRDSGILSSMLRCNCLVEIPPHRPEVNKGERLCVYLL